MKLIVQIPCFNEEKTLPLVVKAIPKRIKGISKIEILIIDDGSTDNTISIAHALGVHHFVIHPQNKGLAHAFANGIHEALKQGADIIVNTDADNQYDGRDIAKLVQPIIENKADIVIGDRQTSTIAHFSKLKKGLQRLGSEMVRRLSGSNVADAVSGFRAYSRDAALHMNIVTDFSYAIESIIQAKYKRLGIESVKVRTNPPTRKSRLFKNMLQHIRMSTMTMLRVYTMYQPFRVFLVIGIVVFLVGAGFGLRFLLYVLAGQGNGHIQSLIFSAVLVMLGFQTSMTGILADLISINRKLTEQNIQRTKQIEIELEQKNEKVIKHIRKQYAPRPKTPPERLYN
jgi:glycosyltransferase involved in cell wall biosynthesis